MAKVYYSDPLFDEVVKQVPERIAREVDLFLDIVYRIDEVLRRKGWSQADLAKAMGKKESEISKWLSGSHNFVLLENFGANKRKRGRLKSDFFSRLSL